MASLGRRLPVTLDANIDPLVNPKTITYAVVDGNSSGPIKRKANHGSLFRIMAFSDSD